MTDRAVAPQEPRMSFGQWLDTTVSGFYDSLDDTFSNFTLAAGKGLDQLQTSRGRRPVRQGRLIP